MIGAGDAAAGFTGLPCHSFKSFGGGVIVQNIVGLFFKTCLMSDPFNLTAGLSAISQIKID